MMDETVVPDNELQGLIERQSVEIELLRAQIAAFNALALAIKAGTRVPPSPVEAVTRREA
jgi:hypothetical protein